MFLAMPRDKDMLATFVHALAFFLAIPRDKDMLATFIHALGVFLTFSSRTSYEVLRKGNESGRGRGGTNRSDAGLNLSGSWQQGHSATYNTPSRI